MPELIDRQALKNHLYRAQAEAFKRSEWYVAGSIQSFIDLLDKQPTIEPEVRHGHWMFLEQKSGYLWKCSNCKGNFDQRFSYCPYCGAEMDFPTVEPEVRRGHWEDISGMDNTVFCSECLAAVNKELSARYKGCPFCLAVMNGGADNGRTETGTA